MNCTHHNLKHPVHCLLIAAAKKSPAAYRRALIVTGTLYHEAAHTVLAAISGVRVPTIVIGYGWGEMRPSNAPANCIPVPPAYPILASVIASEAQTPPRQREGLRVLTDAVVTAAGVMFEGWVHGDAATAKGCVETCPSSCRNDLRCVLQALSGLDAPEGAYAELMRYTANVLTPLIPVMDFLAGWIVVATGLASDVIDPKRASRDRVEFSVPRELEGGIVHFAQNTEALISCAQWAGFYAPDYFARARGGMSGLFYPLLDAIKLARSDCVTAEGELEGLRGSIKQYTHGQRLAPPTPEALKKIIPLERLGGSSGGWDEVIRYWDGVRRATSAQPVP